MFRLFGKCCLSALFALLCLTHTSLVAWDQCCPCPCPCDNNRLYIGAFGGGIYSNSNRLSQMGTAFFTEAEGGPLAVFARGHSRKRSTGFGGAQIGYEWSKAPQFGGCSNWAFAFAGELEAFFYCHKNKGHLINDTVRIPEHDFSDSFHTRRSVILANAVISLKSFSWGGFTPYIGGGIGATNIDLRKATSLQVAPIEPGINHFNSKRSDSSWAFAAQAKAGIRYHFCNAFSVFAEYRYLFIDSSNYILGSTVYPNHAPTSPWNIKFKETHYNAFAIGIQFDL